MMFWRRRLSRKARAHERAEEMRAHLNLYADELIARGRTERDARREARIRFGNPRVKLEEVEDQSPWRWFDAVRRDLRHAVRGLRTASGFTTVVLIVLTLGIGASAAIFSVVDAVVLRGLPFAGSSRLVAVSEFRPSEGTRGPVSPQNFLHWRARQDVFTDLVAIVPGDITLTGDEGIDPVVLRGQRVTAGFFDVLRVAPLRGRIFTRDNEEDGQHRVAVISYGLWQRRFGGADVLGQDLRSADGDYAVVGVMPKTFEYPIGSLEPTEVWVPYVVPASQRQRSDTSGTWYLQTIGRLRDDVSVEQAQARMDQINAGIAAQYPRTVGAVKVDVLGEYLSTRVRSWMFLLLAAVACVLTIACVNVAHLTAVRAMSRAGEIGMRGALGASRWDLARPLLVESLVLSVVGSALGVILAIVGVDLLRSAMPADVPRVAAIAVNFRVLVVVAVASLATGQLFALAPMWQMSESRVAELLKERGRGNTTGVRQQGIGAALIVTEVALAVILVVGASLFVVSFASVSRVDLGFDHRNVAAVSVFPRMDLSSVNARSQAMRDTSPRLERVLRRVEALPGMEAASIVSGTMPLSHSVVSSFIGIPGREIASNDQMIRTAQISPDYFRALGTPLLSGRAFRLGDRYDAVVILNAHAARTYFGSTDRAVGQVVQLGGAHTVIGVVGDARIGGPETEIAREAFLPLSGAGVAGGWLVMRTPDIAPILPAIRRAIWAEFPNLAVPETETMTAFLRRVVAQRELNMLLLGFFGVLGLVLAAVGLYGVMAHQVSRRTQEIGLRMALGGLPARILRTVLRRAMTYLAVGLVIGLTGAWMLAGFAAPFLFRIEPTDPLIYFASATVLLSAGVFAAFIPARRASRIDPLTALRCE